MMDEIHKIPLSMTLVTNYLSPSISSDYFIANFNIGVKMKTNTVDLSYRHLQAASSSLKKEVEPDNIWLFLQDRLNSIMNGADTTKMCFDELYRSAYYMVLGKRSDKLYQGVRRIVNLHLDKMVAQLQSIVHKRDLHNPLLKIVDEAWSDFSEKIVKIRSILLYAERVYEQSIGVETIREFGWRVFRTEILGNEFLRNAMAMPIGHPELAIQGLDNAPESSSSEALEENEGDYMESPLVIVDTIIDIMGFLTANELGLKMAVVSRQMKILSNYVLAKREHILRPIVIYDGKFECRKEFAVLLRSAKEPNPEKKQMDTIFNAWVAPMERQYRIDLPKYAPPHWVAGVQLIYLMDGLTTGIYGFLYALREHLQDCELIFNLCTLWDELRSNKLFWTFVSFFNQRCFSLVHTDVPSMESMGCPNESKLFAMQWPLWAILNNVYFTECRELTLPVQFLKESSQRGVDAAKWLMHPSTEDRPRKLKLYSDKPNWSTNLRGVETMLLRIKDEFISAYERRMFYVEFPKNGLLQYDGRGEWFNGVGEQLRILGLRVTRLPIEESCKEFEDFYAQPGIRPKLMISAYKYSRTPIPENPPAIQTPRATRKLMTPRPARKML